MSEKYQPRPFQRKVLELMMQGKNVILQAPTGAGKTDAALVPFIQNLGRSGDALPQTCLYATPMRVLSTQFYKKYGGRIARLDQDHGTRLEQRYEPLPINPVSIQTGEQQGDPQLESLLTFCTIDQLLASFLGVPYSVDSRRANINVAAIVGSYLILDEFHLYPLLRDDKSCFGARTTTLSMLRLLKSVTRFILMTATFSTSLLNELERLLDAEIVTISDEDLNSITNGRERTFELASAAMNAETVLRKHDRCSLVICNTVLRAQQMYWQIKDRAREDGIEVILLHSRLTIDDRTSRSAEVMHELGQAPKTGEEEQCYGWKNGEYYGKNLIVIATQVVEVGLDISAQTLHTELAPANSLIQRAGRCARFAGQKGKVIVYPLFDAEEQELSSLPYDKSLCAKTWEALHTLHMDQCIVGFKEEQAFIDAVHTEEDKSLLARYESKQGHIEERIFTSLNEHNRSVVSSLIRDVAQVHILIHDDPDNAIIEEPWRWQSFALHPDSLAGRWSTLQKRAADLQLEWVCKQAIAVPEGDTDADNKQKVKYIWSAIPASSQSAVAGALRNALMVVFPSRLATYHDELGFLLFDERLQVPSTGYQSTLIKREKPKPRYTGIRQQSYKEHIGGLVTAYNRGIRENMQYVIDKLDHLIGVPKGSVDQAIRLALACHDLGKLGEQWQQWAWEWQTQLLKQQGWPALPSQPYFFAKTSFDYTPDHKKWRNDMKIKRLPPHACESVAVGFNFIAESLRMTVGDDKYEMLLRAVCGAIAHHHTANAHEYRTIRLQQGADEAVKEALELARQQESWTYDLSHLNLLEIEGNDLTPMIIAPSDACLTKPRQGRLAEVETWLYFVIVRALRLSDQRADTFNQI